MNTSRIAIFIDGGYKPIYVQKEIDIQIGVGLVRLSAKQQVSHAAIAGDSDLVPALAIAKNEGVLVHLYPGHAPHRKLVEAADERTQITTDFLTGVRRSSWEDQSHAPRNPHPHPKIPNPRDASRCVVWRLALGRILPPVFRGGGLSRHCPQPARACRKRRKAPRQPHRRLRGGCGAGGAHIAKEN